MAASSDEVVSIKRGNEIRLAALNELNAAYGEMTSPLWNQKWESFSAEEKKRWSDTLVQITTAIHELRMATLRDILERLVAEEAALSAATQALHDRLQGLEKAEQILKAAAGFLSVVGRIVKLV